MPNFRINQSRAHVSVLHIILQMRNEFGNQWGGPHYGGPVYEGYEYAMTPPHDPSMYAAAYGGYPMYGIHQQQVS